MTDDSQLSQMAAIRQCETDTDTVGSRMNYAGQHVPYGLAGFCPDDAEVVCIECHDEDCDDTDSPIFSDMEADYPGLSCDDCGRYLDTRLLVYRQGPGSELWDEVPESQRI